jgi:Pentapeptide repeats (8 copies)
VRAILSEATFSEVNLHKATLSGANLLLASPHQGEPPRDEPQQGETSARGNVRTPLLFPSLRMIQDVIIHKIEGRGAPGRART